MILGWSPDWYPALRWVILGIGMWWPPSVSPSSHGPAASWPPGWPASASASMIAGPAAYSLTTAATPAQWGHPVRRAGHPWAPVSAGFPGGGVAGGPGEGPRSERLRPATRGAASRGARLVPGGGLFRRGGFSGAAAGGPGIGFGARSASRRVRGRPGRVQARAAGRTRRPAQRHHAGQAARRPPPRRRLEVLLGGRRHRDPTRRRATSWPPGTR